MNFKFEELQVYQKSLDFIDEVYSTTKDFPKDEIYGLSSQFRRAATSIALNIAEGSGGTKKEFGRYLRTAANSVKECVVCATVARRQEYIEEVILQEMRTKLTEIARMISGLRNYLKKE